MGQYRHFRLARLSHADQGRFSLPGLNPGRTDRAGSRSIHGPGATLLGAEGSWHTGVAQLLLQVADDRARALSRARLIHSVDETKEHAASPEGRRDDHPFGTGVLRLG